MLRRTNMNQELLSNDNQALEMDQDGMEDEAETVIDVELRQQWTPANPWPHFETPLSTGQVPYVATPSTEQVASPDDNTA